jgi:signal peptidase I
MRPNNLAGYILSIIGAFIVGILTTLIIVDRIVLPNYQAPFGSGTSMVTYPISNSISNKISDTTSDMVMSMTGQNEELPSPQDWITQDKISVLKDKVIISVSNPEWAEFTDTNSMDPVIDSGSNAIEIIPKSSDEIQAGDIVSYRSEYAEGNIIHRVIKTGYDDQGWYAVMKGDNNPNPDPGKIRFSQIARVVIAVIY